MGQNTLKLFPTEKDLSQGFVKGLTLLLCLALEYLIVVGSTFPGCYPYEGRREGMR